MLSFWITTRTFLIGIALLTTPWKLTLHWMLRIVVWKFLGSWIMIVDKCSMSDGSDHETALAKKIMNRVK